MRSAEELDAENGELRQLVNEARAQVRELEAREDAEAREWRRRVDDLEETGKRFRERLGTLTQAGRELVDALDRSLLPVVALQRLRLFRLVVQHTREFMAMEAELGPVPVVVTDRQPGPEAANTTERPEDAAHRFARELVAVQRVLDGEERPVVVDGDGDEREVEPELAARLRERLEELEDHWQKADGERQRAVRRADEAGRRREQAMQQWAGQQQYVSGLVRERDGLRRQVAALRGELEDGDDGGGVLLERLSRVERDGEESPVVRQLAADARRALRALHGRLADCEAQRDGLAAAVRVAMEKPGESLGDVPVDLVHRVGRLERGELDDPAEARLTAADMRRALLGLGQARVALMRVRELIQPGVREAESHEELCATAEELAHWAAERIGELTQPGVAHQRDAAQREVDLPGPESEPHPERAALTALHAIARDVEAAHCTVNAGRPFLAAVVEGVRVMREELLRRDDEVSEVATGEVLTLDTYQRAAMATRVYRLPGEGITAQSILYAAAECGDNAGALLGEAKKLVRDDRGMTPERKARMWHKLGGLLWGCAAMADELRESLEEVGRANLELLADRHERGVIKGEGWQR